MNDRLASWQTRASLLFLNATFFESNTAEVAFRLLVLFLYAIGYIIIIPVQHRYILIIPVPQCVKKTADTA
jgi:hypothetical protein